MSETRRSRCRALAAAGSLAICVLWCDGLVCAQESGVASIAEREQGGEARIVQERWYDVEMMGSRAGWMHTQQLERGETIISRSEVQLSFSRAAQGATIVMKGEFVETRDGKPVSMRSRQKTGQMVVDQHYTFEEDGVSVRTRQAGRETTQRMKLPEGEWTTPAAAERMMLERFRAGEKSITARTMDPQLGLKIVTQARSGFERVKLAVGGAEVEAIRTIVETDAAPGVKSIEYLDDVGEMLRNETSIGGISVVMTRTTRENARRDPSGPAPEVMISTFVKPTGKAIPEPRKTTDAVYVLTMTEGDLPDVPAGGVQRVKRVQGSVRVGVIVGNPMPAPESDMSNAKFKEPSSTLDSADEEVLKLVERTLKGVPKEDVALRAETLRRAVHGHIREKSLGVGMATASEVVRTREGDCSEHAVLLAACLRADGIPSSVVTGLVYVDEFAGQQGVFGYHMWTRALLRDNGGTARWVDLDATLPDETPTDATHIALNVSSLSDEESMQSLLSVASVLGRLKIEVESISPGAGVQPAGRKGGS